MSGNCFHDQELSRFYLSFVVEFVMSCFESYSDVNNCVYPVPDVSVRQSYRSEDSLHRLFKTDLEGSTRILILRLLTTSSGCIFGDTFVEKTTSTYFITVCKVNFIKGFIKWTKNLVERGFIYRFTHYL